MIWALIISLILLAILAAAFYERRTAARRLRSARWNDLHERGHLITAQLESLQRLTVERGPAQPVQTVPPQFRSSLAFPPAVASTPPLDSSLA